MLVYQWVVVVPVSWKGLPLLQCLMSHELEWHDFPATRNKMSFEFGGSLRLPSRKQGYCLLHVTVTNVSVAMFFLPTSHFDEGGWALPKIERFASSKCEPCRKVAVGQAIVSVWPPDEGSSGWTRWWEVEEWIVCLTQQIILLAVLGPIFFFF